MTRQIAGPTNQKTTYINTRTTTTTKKEKNNNRANQSPKITFSSCALAETKPLRRRNAPLLARRSRLGTATPQGHQQAIHLEAPGGAGGGFFQFEPGSSKCLEMYGVCECALSLLTLSAKHNTGNTGRTDQNGLKLQTSKPR